MSTRVSAGVFCAWSESFLSDDRCSVFRDNQPGMSCPCCCAIIQEAIKGERLLSFFIPRSTLFSLHSAACSRKQLHLPSKWESNKRTPLPAALCVNTMRREIPQPSQSKWYILYEPAKSTEDETRNGRRRARDTEPITTTTTTTLLLHEANRYYLTSDILSVFPMILKFPRNHA